MSKHLYFPLLSVITLCILSACGTPQGERKGPEREEGGASNAQSCQSINEPLRDQLRETAFVLMLTPKQQVFWDSYQESVSALMSDQMRADSNVERPFALQQIDSKVDTVRNRLAAMEEIAEKAKNLYQSLDDKQKKTADQRLSNTVPALYSGLPCQVANTESTKGNMRQGGGGRGPGGM